MDTTRSRTFSTTSPATIGEIKIKNFKSFMSGGQDGAQPVAAFDCCLGVIEIFGVVLMVRDHDDFFIAMPKRNWNGVPGRWAVGINNRALRGEITAAAVSVLRSAEHNP